MPEPRAVLFDLWHTLVYLDPSEEERYMTDQIETMARVFGQWTLSPRGRHPPLHDAHTAAEQVRAEAVEAAGRGVSIPLATQALHGAHRLGRAARPLEYSQALTELVEHTDFRLSPGVSEALAELQRRHFRLGVVSNTIGEPGESLQRMLDRAGVGKYLEAWAFSDQLPWTKPAPEIFWHCLGMLSTRRERCVHVGDGWADLAGARAAGLRAGILYTGERKYGATYGRLIGLNRPELREAEFRVERFADLPELVERLLRE
jgi:HAD superfamily hydrolase (TIGR01549 family)